MFKKILFLVLAVCIFSRIALASFSVNTDYPKEILVEKGWIKYFNVVISNSGDELHGVDISFDGEFSQWFEVEVSKVDLLQSNENASFLVRMNVPNSTEPKAYSFTLNIKSKEISDAKTFAVRVFNSKADSLLYQVQQLENDVEDVQRNATRAESAGKNVTEIKSTLSEAQGYLDESKIYIGKEEYDKVTDAMINAEDLIKRATYDLSVTPSNISIVNSSAAFPLELLMASALIILLIIVFYLVFKKKKKEPVIQPTAKIKEVILEGTNTINLENELQESENSLNLLEEEFKENLLSKESYDELKAKYEKRISDLREEIERNKNV